MSILFKVPLEDHPRMCGEQNQLLMDQVPIPGSPPRVRGTVAHVAYYRISYRITPACAGNSMAHYAVFLLSGDHPRVCGEQRPGEIAYIGEKGSPPRVRGTAYGAGLRELGAGITPACAGNS